MGTRWGNEEWQAAGEAGFTPLEELDREVIKRDDGEGWYEFRLTFRADSRDMAMAIMRAMLATVPMEVLCDETVLRPLPRER